VDRFVLSCDEELVGLVNDDTRIASVNRNMSTLFHIKIEVLNDYFRIKGLN